MDRYVRRAFRKPRDLFALCVVVLGLPAPWARCAEPEFNADRPGVSTPTSLVPLGFVQFEGGFEFRSESGGAAPTHSSTAPFPLLRLGLASRVELRIGGDGYCSAATFNPAGVQRVSGFSDVTVGAKMRLFEETKGHPALVVLPELSAPVGDAHFSSGGYDPALTVLASKRLRAGFEVTGNAGVAGPTGDDGRFLQQRFAVSAGHEIKGLQAGLEVYEIRQFEQRRGGLLGMGVGVSRTFAGKFQLDAQIAREAAAGMRTWIASTGLVVREPLRFLKAHH